MRSTVAYPKGSYPSRVGDSPTRRAKMRKKISKLWAKIRKIDRNLRRKWGNWNSCPPGTARLATALGSFESWNTLQNLFQKIGKMSAHFLNMLVIQHPLPQTLSKPPIRLVMCQNLIKSSHWLISFRPHSLLVSFSFLLFLYGPPFDAAPVFLSS